MLHEPHDTGEQAPPPQVPHVRARTRTPRQPPAPDGLAGRLGVSTRRDGDLTVAVRDIDGDALVVRVIGEVDLATAPTLRDELTCACARADGQRIVLDLAEVGFLGSAGLQVLIEVHKLCRRCGLQFGVLNPQPAALRALQVSGLDKILPLHRPDDVAGMRVERGGDGAEGDTPG